MSTDNIVLVSWGVLIIALQVWLFLAVPPKNLIKKYSRLLLLRSMLPFAKTWKRSIEAPDIEAIQRYRKRAIPYLLILVLSGIILCTYFYFRYMTEVKSLLETGGG